MPKRAQLASGEILEFPDETPDEVIDKAVREMVAESQSRALIDKEVSMSGVPAGGPMERAVNKDFFNPLAALTGIGIRGLRNVTNSPREVVGGLMDYPIGAFQLGANAGDQIARMMGNEPVLGEKVNEYVSRRGEELGNGPSRLAGQLMFGYGALGPQSGGLVKRMIQGGLEGLGFGAASPVEGDNYWQGKAIQTALGGGIGAAIPPLFALNDLRPSAVRRNAGNLMADSLGDRHDMTVNALMNNTDDLATAGQVAAQRADDGYPIGTAEFMGMQRMGQNNNPTPYLNRVQDQNAQRLSQIRSIGGTEDDLARAYGNRAGQSNSLYEAAYGRSVEVDGNLAEIMKNPFVEPYIKVAKDLMESDGFKVGNRLNGENATRFIHYIKKAMDGKIYSTGDQGLDPTIRRATLSAQEKLLDWLDNANPDYAAARAKYAELSRPIEKMEVGQRLEQKLSPALSEYGAFSPQTRTQYANAVRNEDLTIRQATGSRVPKTLQDVLGADMSKVDDIAASLGRDATFGTYGAAGENAASGMVSTSSGKILPSILDREVVILNNAMSRLGMFNRDGILRTISEVMLDPKATAELISKSNPAEREAIRRIARTLGINFAQNIER
jgi:hypothetical protein